MTDHIQDTTATYDAVASSYLENTRDRGLDFNWLESFAEGLPEKSKVLDFGSGPGRDSADLEKLGLYPVCLDRSIGMLGAGTTEYPNPRILGDMLSVPFRDASLAGVWANASLLHLSPNEFDRALCEVLRVLRPGGGLHLSLKEGRGAGWETKRYNKRRWFQYWSEADLDRALKNHGFEIMRAAKEATSDHTWLVRQCVSGA